ncbi:hypothetical protein BV22DRAFT_1128953 [Leucogyrophana mollusca]|uniref:Uncharacterized protein n=1 Tax=Leucogyrophana mollusca TaxID=85980 RepID=A0ACB8BLU9_9AGAM|nr:hypothetical protein BV22DRAFT_1128953 [Leucogyrophana mollusca]
MSALYNPVDVSLAEGLQTVDFVFVALATISVFDYAINLDDEVMFILNSRWTSAKVVYIICRYTPFLIWGVQGPLILETNMDPSVCLPLFAGTTGLTMIILCGSEYIFLLRTYALWACSRRVQVVLLASFVVILVPIVTVLAKYQTTVTTSKPPLSIMPGCNLQSHNQTFLAAYALLVLFELEVFILSVYRVLKYYRDSRSQLLKILARHSIFYFACALALGLMNICAVFFLPNYFSGFFGVFQAIAQGLLVTKMQFYLWKADQEPMLPSLSTIDFPNVVAERTGVQYHCQM